MAVVKGAGAEADIQKHRSAVRANPRSAQAHALLGLALQRAGKLDEAVASQRRALQLDPSLTDLHAVMAPALHELGRHEDAVDSYRRALMVQKADADLHKGLSVALRLLGQLDAAVDSARRAVELLPSDVDSHITLAAGLYGLRDYEQAADSFRCALALAPDRTDVRTDLGRTLFNLRQYEAAAECYRKTIELKPDYFDAHTLLGACLRELKQYDEAASCYRRALEISPNHPGALHDLALSQHQFGDLEAAHATFLRALDINPDDKLVLASLAHTCFGSGSLEEALQFARRVRELDPDSARANSIALFILSHYTNDPAELTAEHFKFGERFEAAYRGHWQPHPNQRDPERRLKIGFVSADLYHHAVARFIEPIFEVLKHSTQLSLHIYYNNVVEDAVTRNMRAGVAHWHPIADLDDDALERQIRADGIDILIDLSGHSALNRLPLFARKPAPVQASWIGYAGTTGLQAMDYYLSDQFHLPEGRYDDQFTEQIVRLPLGAPFQPEPVSPPVNPLPALANGYLTFGSFHRASKLSREVIALWAQLLRALPDSKMVLGGLDPGGDARLLGWFDQEGIDRSRLLLRRRTSVYEYLAQHHEVDVCLSPFPYSGSTTICHALWMGVPTLTTIGPTNPSYSSVCYLAHLGLSSFLADDDASFVQLGEFLSQNLSTVAALRNSMRERFVSSVVGYPGVAAAGLEHALRLMWQRWCADLPPAPLRVRLSDLVPPEQESAA